MSFLVKIHWRQFCPIYLQIKILTSLHLVATVPPRVDKKRRRRRVFAKNRQFFSENRQFFTENWRFFTENRQLFTENRQNAANISIFRLLGDLARQYQVFWAKMPPMNLDQKGH